MRCCVLCGGPLMMAGSASLCWGDVMASCACAPPVERERRLYTAAVQRLCSNLTSWDVRRPLSGAASQHVSHVVSTLYLVCQVNSTTYSDYRWQTEQSRSGASRRTAGVRTSAGNSTAV